MILAALANGDLRTERDGRGALTVDNLTASELRDLCHYFETGERLGVLHEHTARGLAVATQFGSPALLEAMDAPPAALQPPLFDPTKLSLDDVSKHCESVEVRTVATLLASRLAGQLHPTDWRRFPVLLQFDLFDTNAPRIAADHRGHYDDVIREATQDRCKGLLALVAVRDWLQAAGAPPVRFSGTANSIIDNYRFSSISCHFAPHTP